MGKKMQREKINHLDFKIVNKMCIVTQLSGPPSCYIQTFINLF